MTGAVNTADACGTPFEAVVAGAVLSAAAAERLNAAQHNMNPMTDFNGRPPALTRALFGGSGDRAKTKLYSKAAQILTGWLAWKNKALHSERTVKNLTCPEVQFLFILRRVVLENGCHSGRLHCAPDGSLDYLNAVFLLTRKRDYLSSLTDRKNLFIN